MKGLEEEGYKYLGILEIDNVKHEEMKEKLKKEYIRRVRSILKSKLNGGNIIQAINARAVSIIRYGAGIISWRVDELKAVDRKTRKLLTIYGALHPQADVDRLYYKRAGGGQKGCRRKSRGTKDQLLIDKMVMRSCKRRLCGLGMA